VIKNTSKAAELPKKGGQKPEHMTSLRGDMLVSKDHPRIRLRGRLDGLQARILEAQILFRRLGQEKAVSDLGEVLGVVRAILRCEVLDEPLEQFLLLGMDEEEIRARSHRPKDYYGLQHFFASVDDGEAVITLNSLRTLVREAELAFYDAFKHEDGRADLALALNRLSSVFYVMMFKAKTGEYS
jgi:ethanolamine utilization cobalamin adenosyltransferase